MNAWFLENIKRQNPVRVIRKSTRKIDEGTSRLVYSGLYHVIEHWRVDRDFGDKVFKVCKFLLMHVKAYDYNNPPIAEIDYIHTQLEFAGLK